MFQKIKMHLIMSIVACIFLTISCAPTLKNSAFKPTMDPVEYFDQPLVPQALGVATLKDSRPFGERFSTRMAVYDLFAIPLTFGFLGINRLFPQYRVQPISDVDTDMADYFAEKIKQTNLFENVVRLSEDAELFVNGRQIQKAKEKGVDLVLAGEIKRFYGDWKTGGAIGTSVRDVPSSSLYAPPGKEITTTYSMTECQGITLLSLTIIDVVTGNKIWSKDIESSWSCNSGINLQPFDGDIPERNRLAARSFNNAISDVIRELKQWASAYESGKQKRKRDQRWWKEYKNGLQMNTR